MSSSPCLRCPHFAEVPTVEFFERHGVSRTDLARICGVSRSQVTRWAQGRIPVWHVDTLHRLRIEIVHRHAAAEEVETYDDL